MTSTVPGATPDTVPGPQDAAAPGGPPGPPGPPPRVSPSSLAPTGRSLWHRSRWYLLTAAVVLLSAALLAGLNQDRRYPPLDPRSYDPSGSHAVIALLQREGLRVDVTTDLPARTGGNDTVVVPEPDLLGHDQLRALAAAGHTRLVLVAPGPDALAALVPGVRFAEETGPAYASVRSTDPKCGLAEAVRAGSAHLGGVLYTAGSRGEGCYPRGTGYPLVTAPTGKGTEAVVLGSGDFLRNELVKKDGNASLALGLLGSRPTLTWVLPDYSAPLAEGSGHHQVTDFVPDGWRWAAYQLAAAVLLTAFWRARRLGPVISENLPVVVRAAETTEGRARLYRRAKAHGRAADALRRATAHRLAPALGVPLHAGAPDPTALCAAIADRLPEPPAGDVRALLYGPPPTDDAALLRLADDLDALERQVRKP
ncbi:DUF4350 domain-containing protein [Kitasatospora sp. NBC_01560]|uniref:DUF4350 domain-containing protein n=1 Tax=Kitasatospora sp. NBC_01560 TaxID=2975965 RepID=UPI0038685FB5